MAMTHDATRRALLKRAAYVAPMVLTLQATSAVAKSGSVGCFFGSLLPSVSRVESRASTPR